MIDVKSQDVFFSTLLLINLFHSWHDSSIFANLRSTLSLEILESGCASGLPMFLQQYDVSRLRHREGGEVG